MKYTFKYIYFIVLISITSSFSGCSSFFDADADDTLLEGDHYGQSADLNAGFIGVAALFQDVAEKVVLIEGLRSDLMTPTAKAPSEVVDVANFTATNGNSLVDPTVIYKTIVGSNDFLRHAIEFDKQHPGLVNDVLLEGMIAEVVRYRAWCYLTLGKIYGEAIYHDYGMTDNVDISKSPKLSIDELVLTLIGQLTQNFMGYDINRKLDWNLITNADDEVWNRVSINHQVLLGELYLWNKEFAKASRSLLQVIGQGDDAKLYTVVKPNNIYDWRKFFTEIGGSLSELITVVPFDDNKGQQNVLQTYFSNFSPANYYIKPSSVVIDLFDAQMRGSNKIDVVRKNGSVREIDGEWVIVKYHMDKASYERDAHISIYRAAEVHLMIAEAFAHLGQNEEALAFLNAGLKSKWSGSSFNYPFNNPIFSTKLKENAGVRGRVTLSSRALKTTTPEEKLVELNGFIADEVALELAFEGKRFFTLVRMARNMNNPEFIAKRIGKKISGSEEEYATFMMQPENWFVKYDHLK